MCFAHTQHMKDWKDWSWIDGFLRKPGHRIICVSVSMAYFSAGPALPKSQDKFITRVAEVHFAIRPEHVKLYKI